MRFLREGTEFIITGSGSGEPFSRWFGGSDRVTWSFVSSAVAGGDGGGGTGGAGGGLFWLPFGKSVSFGDFISTSTAECLQEIR